MIDLQHVWIPQVLGYARLMVEPETLHRAWIEGDRSRTSVTDLTELLEQVFDDLDSEAMLERARSEIADKELLSRLQNFIGGLLAIERQYDDASLSADAFNTEEWKNATGAAEDLLLYAKDWPNTRPGQA